MDHHLALQRVLEPNHRTHTRLRLRTPTTTPVVAGLLPGRLLLSPQGIDLFFAAVAMVGLALLQPLINDLAVTIESLGLKERPLIMIQPQPGHAIKNGVHVFLGGALPVRVLDAQDELPAVMPGVQPAKECGTDAADVQDAGWAGGETGADNHIRQSLQIDIEKVR